MKNEMKNEKKFLKNNRKYFLGFAWIMSDILSKIPSLRSNMISDVMKNTLVYQIGNNMMNYWIKTKNNLENIMASKMVAFKYLRKELLKINIDAEGVNGTSKNKISTVSLFGSVVQFLCDQESDIDVYVQEYVQVKSNRVDIYLHKRIFSY
jgi:hypothetical protein